MSETVQEFSKRVESQSAGAEKAPIAPGSAERAAANAAYEAADDAFLAKLSGGDGQGNPAQAPQGAAQGVESEKVKGDAEADHDLDRALTALDLDQVPESVVDKLDRTALLEWGAKAKERQAKTASELQARSERIKALEAEIATLKPGGNTQRAETGNGRTTQEDADELETLKQTFGDELAAPLAKLLKRREAESGQRVALLESLLERQLESSAKAGLRERFPQIDDPTKFALVKKEMESHYAKYRGEDPETVVANAMRDAARVIFFDESEASDAGRRLASHRKRLASQPAPPSGRTSNQKALTHAEREDAILDAILRGDNAEKERLMRAV
jgi:hypothetical protein